MSRNGFGWTCSGIPTAADMERLNKTAAMIGATRRFLVSKTGKVAGDDRRASCDLPWLLEFMQQW